MRQWVEDETAELHRDVDAAQWGLRPSWAKEKGPAPIRGVSSPLVALTAARTQG